MRKLIWAGLLAGISLLSPVAAPAADMMKPGLWEITTTMELPGMPFQPPPQTMRHCYTAQEIRNEPIPRDANCKILELRSSGSKVSWKVECTGEMAGKGEGEMIYQGDSAYEGQSRLQAQGMTITTRYKGKRLGECK